MVHTCKPSYSGSRDQEDHGSKPSWANSSVTPCLEKPFTKIGLVQLLKVKVLSSSSKTMGRMHWLLKDMPSQRRGMNNEKRSKTVGLNSDSTLY
jgi:hypothetical protein